MKTVLTDDVVRFENLEDYEVLGAAPDSGLEEITALAASLCGTSIAGISLLAPDGLHIVARFGPGPSRVQRRRMPCDSAVQGEGLYEIPDARYHPDFRPDGIMISGRAFRFYAGVPLTMPSGSTLGCLFVQDPVPRTLTPLQRQTLQVLARQVVARFELHARVRSMDQEGRVRHRVESALTVERNFVSTVLDTVGALVAVFDTAGRIVRFNRTCEQVSGYDSQAQVGRYLWEQLIPTDDIPEAVASFERLRSGRFPASFENHWLHRDGSLKRIAWSATALVDPQGQTNFIIATGIDVTVQREAEATLRESEARYRQLVEGSLGVVCTHDMQGALLSMNAHGADSIGYVSEEMVGRNLADFMHPDRRDAVPAYLEEIRNFHEAQGRLFLQHRDGTERVIAFRNKLIEMHGRDPYVLAFGVDVTEQVDAEDRLRNLIHQSDSILESVGDGIFGLDLEGRGTVINPAAAQMLGYKTQELLGRRMHELIHHTRTDGTPYPPEESAIMNSIHSLDTMRVSNELFWRKDGTSFPVEYVSRPQIDAREEPDGTRTGHAIGLVVAFTDTTERSALDRMKDEFISTVSHELRTPLTSLRAALGLITGGALQTRPERMKQMLDIAIGNTDRLVRLVNDILDIERISSGNAELHSRMCSAQELLERAANLQSAAADKVNIRFRIDAAGVEVWADHERILQALTNLISNAIKFSPAGGEITLTARPVDAQEVQFDIHDQGRGIPEDKLENIFERFHQVDGSDSRTMGGTGLGLAICRSIIAQHGGHIWASSPPGDGATFHFTLQRRPASYL